MNELFPTSFSESLTQIIQQNIQFIKDFEQQHQISFGKKHFPALSRVLVSSQFIQQFFQRKPHWIVQGWQEGFYQRSIDQSEWPHLFSKVTENVIQTSQLSEKIRHFRNQHMIRIALRDIAGWADLQETMQDLSRLADICIQASLKWLHKDLSKTFGTPCVEENGRQREVEMIVIAMGKLGACELNYSSDIDLIFVFPAHGKTINGKRSLSNNEFFIKLARLLIQMLDERNAHGYVFRVDMRLRPFGKSGPLAITINAMEDYYATHGREWERYAMIKGRMVSGHDSDQQALQQALNPFIYRRYIDFGVFESLREMKQMIANEVKLKKLEHNIKLGAGGIREIEFLAQAFQLLRGGRETDLQQRQVQKILPLLKSKDMIPGYVVDDLLQAYEFLRNTEHRLQEYEDKQTQCLPQSELELERLAFSMGFESLEEFMNQLSAHRKKVHENFMQLFQAPQVEHEQEVQETPRQQIHVLWTESIKLLNHDETIIGHEEALKQLKVLNFTDPEQILKYLLEFRQSQNYRKMSAEAKQRLDTLMPLVLNYLYENKLSIEEKISQAECLKRLNHVFETICRRSVYLSLLIENPLALSQLIQLCAASVWISREISKTPALLDELLDPRVLYSPLNKNLLNEDLQQKFNQINKDDQEQQLEVLRHFKQAHILRVAAADVTGAIEVIKVSDYLTWIAETILDTVIQLAWQDTVKKLGCPLLAEEKMEDVDINRIRGFAIIGYGKVGGIELGYGSDLDLVFVYADEFQKGTTQGHKSVDNSLFFIRLGQRIMHIIGVRTYSGILYECDMRLRPNGNSGQIACSLSAFKNYQLKNAWLWEHQALCRARLIAGDMLLTDNFSAIRQEILIQERDTYALKQEVATMRYKMREALVKHKEGFFDVKQAAGGIVDIEFMVQFLLLLHSHQSPSILEYSDNLRQLQNLGEAHIVDQKDAQRLTRIYQQYRGFMHQQALQEAEPLARIELFEQQQQEIETYWNSYFTVNLA